MQLENIKTENIPVQVTTIKLTKKLFKMVCCDILENNRLRNIAYINGKKHSLEDNPTWDTWFSEDSQMKLWIVNYALAHTQSLKMRKRIAKDMWIILEQMYG